jgi:hypothetical protein
MTEEEFELIELQWTLQQWLDRSLATLDTGERITYPMVVQWRRRIAELKRQIGQRSPNSKPPRSV